MTRNMELSSSGVSQYKGQEPMQSSEGYQGVTSILLCNIANAINAGY